jgi:predicted secreted protein
LGGESKGKEPRRVHAYIPQQIPKRKASKTLRENCQEKAPKITKKENREELKQDLRNHAESSIHTMRFIQGLASARSSYPLTRSHHEALKLVLEIPREKEGENRKTK